MCLSAVDKRILNIIQEEIPLALRPFKILAKKIGIGEEELLAKIKEFKEKNIIRMYSAGLSHRKLKFQSTLIALKAPPNKLSPIVDYLTNFREVTHCYLRKNEYNLWFVFLYKNGKLNQVLNKLSKQIGRENILNLRTLKQFKLRTNLKI